MRFPWEMLNQPGKRGTISDIARSQAAREQLAVLIDCQVELEPEEPTHRRRASPGIADVHEADRRTGSILALQGGEHWDHQGRQERDETWRTDRVWTFARKMHVRILCVIGFERPRVRLVNMDHNGHDLAGPQLACVPAAS